MKPRRTRLKLVGFVHNVTLYKLYWTDFVYSPLQTQASVRQPLTHLSSLLVCVRVFARVYLSLYVCAWRERERERERRRERRREKEREELRRCGEEQTSDARKRLRRCLRRATAR